MIDFNKLEKIVAATKETIIVEGKRDKNVLKKLGFKNIVSISGKSLHNFVESLTEDSIIILTDFDSEGERKAKKLSKLIRQRGIKINTVARKKFKSFFKVQKIEELKYITKLIEISDQKVSTFYNKILNRNKFFRRIKNHRSP
jgi:5S rRNA maturation endonuclease (ribonuclease M5)